VILKIEEISFGMESNRVPVEVMEALPVQSAAELLGISCLQSIEEL
jgi:hypothetical protein